VASLPLCVCVCGVSAMCGWLGCVCLCDGAQCVPAWAWMQGCMHDLAGSLPSGLHQQNKGTCRCRPGRPSVPAVLAHTHSMLPGGSQPNDQAPTTVWGPARAPALCCQGSHIHGLCCRGAVVVTCTTHTTRAAREICCMCSLGLEFGIESAAWCAGTPGQHRCGRQRVLSPTHTLAGDSSNSSTDITRGLSSTIDSGYGYCMKELLGACIQAPCGVLQVWCVCWVLVSLVVSVAQPFLCSVCCVCPGRQQIRIRCWLAVGSAPVCICVSIRPAVLSSGIHCLCFACRSSIQQAGVCCGCALACVVGCRSSSGRCFAAPAALHV
jgi:hypothetical protein